jgi:Tol biopolymer transport system component
LSFFRLLIVVSLVATAALGVPARAPAASTPEQITDDDGESGCSSVSVVADAAADTLAWQSDCDPAGTNADGSIEIFLADEDAEPVQLTSGSGCSSGDPSISASGARVAFTSNCDLAGENIDGNIEIFLWKGGSKIDQLTHSQGCNNFEPDINGLGTFIAYDSNCNLAGFNNGGRGTDIFRVTAGGVVKQMTFDPNGGACDSSAPSINDAGSLIAFDSDCNLTGQNEDLAIQIFTVTGGGVDGGTVEQRTASDEESCSSLRPSIDAEGTIVAYHGDCNPTGENGDRSEEIFTIALASSDVVQVSDGDENLCASGEVHMAASGRALVFTSYCELANENSDGSVEVFHAGVGASASATFAVTEDSNCASVAGGISSDGTLVSFDSDCDFLGDNDDGSIEAFRASTCTCGAPSTRADPKASDALFILRAAVGSSVCVPCSCDVDDNGSITALDALRDLKFAVGQPIAITCPD